MILYDYQESNMNSLQKLLDETQTRREADAKRFKDADGDLTTLNVYAEQPSSFYVSVEKHDERYMNGGIILHGDRGYSSHS